MRGDGVVEGWERGGEGKEGKDEGEEAEGGHGGTVDGFCFGYPNLFCFVVVEL